MTAPLADQATSPIAEQTAPQSPRPAGKTPKPSAGVVSVSLASAAWAVYFASLVAVYLTAFTREVMPCQAAAGWGLAIAFAAALLAVPFAVSGPPAARRTGLPVPRALGWAVGGMLALASVAVIWVAVNLTLSRDTAGAWTLTVCATAAPVAVVLARLAFPPDTRIAGDDMAVAPPAVMPPEPEPVAAAGVAVADVVAPGVVVPDVVPPDVVAAPDVVVPDVVPPDVVAAPDVLAPDVPVPDVVPADTSPPELSDSTVTDVVVVPDVALPPARAPQPAKVWYPSLLAPDWEERLGARPPRVAIDAGMWQAVLAALGRRRVEVGGVALTVRVPGTLIVLGLVLPQQVHASGVFCEFRSEEVSRVRDVIDGVTDILDLDSRDVKITWVHTHPGMGPFLSGTDQATTETWRAFDPEFTPIVLDPLAQRLDRQIGVFDTGNRKIEHLRVVEGLADSDAVGLLKNELVDAYREAKGTMVLFGAD